VLGNATKRASLPPSPSELDLVFHGRCVAELGPVDGERLRGALQLRRRGCLGHLLVPVGVLAVALAPLVARVELL
jgi:hypothetical protein